MTKKSCCICGSKNNDFCVSHKKIIGNHFLTKRLYFCSWSCLFNMKRARAWIKGEEVFYKLTPEETPLQYLDLTMRTYNCLNEEGLNTISKIRAKTDSELLKIPYFGKHCLAEVKKLLLDFDKEYYAKGE